MLKHVFQKEWKILFTLLLFCVPPFSSKGYSLWETGQVNGYILTHAWKSMAYSHYPIFKIIPILLMIAVFLVGNKVRKFFSLYVAISYVLFGLFQSISISETYGVGICLSHLFLSSWIAFLWFCEIYRPENNFSRSQQSFWKFWVFIPALFAFWEPANPTTGLPDFKAAYWLTSGAGLTFCMMTPLYLAILTILYPKINIKVFQVTSIVGFFYALGNIWIAFFMNTNFWWIGILHLPLLILSANGLILAFGNPVSWFQSLQKGNVV